MLNVYVELSANASVRFQQKKFPIEGGVASILAIETLVEIQEATVMFERSDSKRY